MEPQKNRNPHYLEIRIPGIQASNNLGNLGWVPTLGELGYVHTLGELGCAHTLGELGYVHTLGWESLAAVSHWKIMSKIIKAEHFTTDSMNFKKKQAKA